MLGAMPGGRPTKLTQVIRREPDGSPVTAGQHVIARVELGLDLVAAARESNIGTSTLHEWRQRGASARALLAQGKPVEPRELPFVDWLNDFEAAEAAAELRYLTVIDTAATQPQRYKKLVVKKEMRPVNGVDVLVVVEQTETVEERPPQWTAAAWRLERTMPAKYGRRIEVAPAGSAGGMTVEDRASAIGNDLRAYLQGVADAKDAGPLYGPEVIDVDSTEA